MNIGSIIITLRKLAAIFIAVLTLFLTAGDKSLGDSYDPDTFTQICAQEKADGNVRVMSFNVRSGDVKGVPMPARIPNVIYAIETVKPDSVGLQEATPFWTAALDLMLDGYARVGGGLGKYSVIYYNTLEYTLVDSGDFYLSETPCIMSKGWDAEYYRNCCWARLKNKVTGEEYIHINSHYDNIGKEAIVMEANMVTEMMKNDFKGMPFVFTADLNASRNSQVYEIMTEQMKDSSLEADDIEAYATYHAGEPAFVERRIIDFVLYNDCFEATAYRTVTEGYNNRFVSDHFPIYADLKFVD